MGTAATGLLRRELAICNKRGLHARAAARFVQCAERFDAAALELMTTDPAAGCDFYADQFGWTKGESMTWVTWAPTSCSPTTATTSAA